MEYTNIIDFFNEYPNVLNLVDFTNTPDVDGYMQIDTFRTYDDGTSYDDDMYYHTRAGAVEIRGVSGYDGLHHFHYADDSKPRIAYYLSDPLAFDVVVENGYIKSVSGFTFEVLNDTADGIPDTLRAVRGMHKSGSADYSGFYDSLISFSPYLTWENNNDEIDKLRITSNIPMYKTRSEAESYINTGDIGTPLNLNVNKAEGTPRQYYWEQTIYKYDNAFNNKTYIEKIKYYYTGVDDNFRVCGWIDDSLPAPYNVSFKISNSKAPSGYYFSHNSSDRGTHRPSISGIPEKGLRGKVNDANWIYYSVPHTNIPVAGSYDDAIRYTELVVDDVERPKIPASDLNYKHTGDDAGDQTTEQINKNFAEPLLSSQYICTANQMQAIADVIFTENETSAEALKKGLEFYGENPVNDIIDVYHVPFDVSGFISKTGNSKIKFGAYLSDAEGQRITAHGNIVTVGDANISPIYNDFRDYDGTINIDLYLPFLGIIPLDVNCYMGRNLSIKATADTRSHNIRYYLFSDNVLMSFHDTAFGKPITLMGNDMASKFRQNMTANINMSNANEQLRLSNFGNALGVVNSLSTGDALNTLTRGVSGVINAQSGRTNVESQKELNNLDFYNTKAGRTFSGSQACGCSENDILYPYIIFRIQSTKEPANLLHSYGKPCNIVDKIGTVKGYAQMDSVHLETDAPQHIKQRILNELSAGVVIN